MDAQESITEKMNKLEVDIDNGKYVTNLYQRIGLKSRAKEMCNIVNVCVKELEQLKTQIW